MSNVINFNQYKVHKAVDKYLSLYLNVSPESATEYARTLTSPIRRAMMPLIKKELAA